MLAGLFGSKAPEKLTARQKLKEYHALAKEAAERAYAADVAHERERALQLYSTTLQVIEEALQLNVPTSGLGPKGDSVALWVSELTAWRDSVSHRCRMLQSGQATTSAPAHPTQARPQQQPTLLPRPVHPPVATRGVARTPSFTNHHAAGGRAPSSTPVGPRAAAPPPAGEGDKYRQLVLAEVLDHSPGVRWADVVGLETAKQALQEAVVLPSLRADIFQGLRAPVRGLLLYGPPGNGKTMLARALATEARCTFFSISASSLTSKWVGEAEKLVRALFQVAAERQPAIIFMDEIDSVLSARSANEQDSMRRLKTEFLVQFDGVATGSDRVVVIGATNRPEELDTAVRRRLVKRIYIPLPSAPARRQILAHLLCGPPGGTAARVSGSDLDELAALAEGYSASDLTALCKEAAMAPVRELGPAIASAPSSSIRPVVLPDLKAAMRAIRPSVGPEQLAALEEFTREYGTT